MKLSMTAAVCLFLLNVFLSAISQVMLKKSALKSYPNKLREYLNPLVVGAYFILFINTIMGVICYRTMPVSLGPALEATAYVYVMIFGVTLFGEKLNFKKIGALGLIIAGILVYSLLPV